MTDFIELDPVSGPLSGSVRPPGSKSISNRALIVAALAEGESLLSGVLDCDDTRVMIESLQRLGISVDYSPEEATARLIGCEGSPPASQAELWLENSGTSIRFLTALCALGEGEYLLDGNDRMRERPIIQLVDALNALGSDVSCVAETSCPPVKVRGAGNLYGQTEVKGNISSQYLSALLMAAPCSQETVELIVKGPLVSEPYIDMTLGVMAQFGVAVELARENHFICRPSRYRGTEYFIEPDASAASYFFAAAAITQGTVKVEGLSQLALQGDVRFVEVLEQMGAQVSWDMDSITVTGKPLQGVDVDMNSISDTAQTAAAVAVFAEGPTTIRNVGHMRHKETDRISAVANELRRLGQEVEESEDSLTIHPREVTPASIETYDDHRMAMSFALIGLKHPGIRIQDPDCTAKTYPHYFEDLRRLCESAR